MKHPLALVQRRIGEVAPAFIRIAQGAKHEMCGLLYFDAVCAVANVSASPATEYAMDAAGQIAAMEGRGWPVAVWHTHPGNRREPSSLDVRSALPGVAMVIATPDGWCGTYIDGEQMMEVIMAGSNDTVEMFKGDDGDWYGRRVAPNGQVISTLGEGYKGKAAAARAAERAWPDVFETAGPESSAGGDAVGGGTVGSTPSYGPGGGGGPVGPGSGPGSNSAGVGPTGV